MNYWICILNENSRTNDLLSLCTRALAWLGFEFIDSSIPNWSSLWLWNCFTVQLIEHQWSNISIIDGQPIFFSTCSPQMVYSSSFRINWTIGKQKSFVLEIVQFAWCWKTYACGPSLPHTPSIIRTLYQGSPTRGQLHFLLEFFQAKYPQPWYKIRTK